MRTKLEAAARQAADPSHQQDLADMIAGELQVSRSTAYEMMRKALAEQQAAEPVTTVRSDAVNLARNMLEVRNCKGITPHGVRVLCEAVLQMDEKQAAEPVAWQPIETAPKDGRKVILFYLNSNNKARTVMARWLTDEEAAETDGDGVGLNGGWYECIDNWGDYTEVAIHEGDPSHWMHLPKAPAARSITGSAK